MCLCLCKSGVKFIRQEGVCFFKKSFLFVVSRKVSKKGDVVFPQSSKSVQQTDMEESREESKNSLY